MKKRTTNKLYEPIKILPGCLCPTCLNASMAYKETDTIYACLDEDGVASGFVANTQRVFVCMRCGFMSDKYVITDKGWRYDPYDEGPQIQFQNQDWGLRHEVEQLKENPFVKEA